ncbi:hypothetical protein sos41_30340 [Alphaproteobacteria bacterium SO-S41]|nr:hypothetical protein sos41_30340 [Alphaproteobacteria bacterium SO-S41]
MPANEMNASAWIKSPPRRKTGGIGPMAFFAFASVAVMYLVSSLMLTMLGMAYETSGGAQWQKIAPATYFAFLALLAMFAERRNAMALLDEIIQRHKGTLVFLITWAMLFAYIVVFQGSPLTATFDSFLLPIALSIIVVRLSPAHKRSMALFIHVFMAANALLGIAEFGTGWRLTPIVAQGMELNSDYRSSALLGHPLNNALHAASYALMLLLGGGRDLTSGWRAAALLLQIFAMAVFGGRFATLLFGLFAGVIAFRHAILLLNGRKFSVNAAAAAAFLVPVLVIGIILLVADGFLDKFIMRFISDEGSAASRVRMFDLIGRIPFHELLVGADPEVVATLQRTEGIAFGIESFWIAFIAYYGILISLPFFIGLLTFFYDLWRATQVRAFWPILFFLTVCSTSASLSGKSTTLAQFVVMLLILMRRAPRPRPAEAR